MQDPATPAPQSETASTRVRQLRQILLWPLRLMPIAGAARQRPWQVLRELGAVSPWREVVDEYTGDREGFHERHYNEFVTFLPYVQQFLYGEGHAAAGPQPGDPGPPMRVFRRSDVFTRFPSRPRCARCSSCVRSTSASTRCRSRSRNGWPT